MVTPAHARGFTLTELMAVVAVLAILSAVAAPSFTQLVGTMHARAAASELYASLSLARSEAIKRNADVTLEASGGQLGAGWHIYDPANAGVKLDDHPAIANATIGGPASVTFMGNGRLRGGGEPSFDIAIAGVTQHRCVSLDLTGRADQSSTGCTP